MCHEYAACLAQTDDKGVFSTSLSEEYFIASLEFSLSKTELFLLSLKAIDCIFDESVKQSLVKVWDTYDVII